MYIVQNNPHYKVGERWKEHFRKKRSEASNNMKHNKYVFVHPTVMYYC